MKTSFLAMATVALFACMAANVNATLYDFVDFTGFAPDWSFDGGTITTQGSLGIVTSADVSSIITDWNINFTEDAGTGVLIQHTLTSANSSVSYTETNGVNLQLTFNDIGFPTQESFLDNDVLSFETHSGVPFARMNIDRRQVYLEGMQGGAGSGVLAIFGPTVIATIASSSFVCDVNNDGAVDAGDAAVLFANWGTVPPANPIADCNGDGLVDAADASIMFAEWTGDVGAAAPAFLLPEPVVPAALLIAGMLGARFGQASTRVR